MRQRDAGRLPRIQGLKAEPLCGDYRRIWAHLHCVEGLSVNKKRVLRVLREHNLLVTPNSKLKAPRTPSRSQPRPTKPHAWWSIDMTKVMVEDCGWVDIMLVLPWYTNKIVGYYAGVPYTARHWLAALDMAVSRRFPEGTRDQGLSLMRDHGCQPTALAFMKACSTLGMQQAFTSYNLPKATRLPKESCGRSKKNASGCRSGLVPWPSSGRWKSGLRTITSTICTPP